MFNELCYVKCYLISNHCYIFQNISISYVKLIYLYIHKHFVKFGMCIHLIKIIKEVYLNKYPRTL